ncbi:hypothetical protein [Streptomyces anulatus]|uniref:Uncharacterized protein n=1 Tax=Streptomyces anulatus TaxID=1892 RepID=A0A7K3REX7_STRAQ|nr:hypothetical protein [Streptomyces anulatus]NDZ58459.1 hypothetical protein [Streptomyces anulatus]NEC00760.1 hypothetical protein [Streptomyces anulatus]NED29332.1 hypothetical protein [Streptomyces anulatus]
MIPEPHEHLPPRPHDEELFRDALHRTVGPVSLQPDLVPDAVREGHRRRARARAFAVVGTFVAVTAVTLGLAVLGPWLLAGPDTGPAAPAGPSLSLPAPPPTTPPSPRRTEPRPDMPSTTSTPVPTDSAAVPPIPPTPTPSSSVPSGLGPEEARRLEEFRRQAAGALDALLPASIGTVLPVGDGPESYQGRRGGTVHSVRLSVRPEPGSPERACRDIPEKGLTCEDLTLDDGMPARVYRQPAEGRTGTEVSLRYRSGRSTVALSVSPAPSGAGGAPVTAGDLVRVAQSPRFRELIAYADENPVPWSGAAS